MKMALFFTFLFLVTSKFQARSQPEHKVDIGDISVQLPSDPKKANLDGMGEMYICRSNGCGYLITVLPNAIKDYSKYQTLKEREKIKYSDSILTNFIEGKLSTSSNKTLISRTRFQSKKNFGWEIKYSAPDPTRPEKKDPLMRFSKVVLIGNTLYAIECWYLDDKDHETEKEKFFGSLLLKN